jgi:hypothetical protein
MVITHVSVKKTEGGYNVLKIEDFVSLSIQERTELLIQKKIGFLDEYGENVPLLDGVKFVGTLAKKSVTSQQQPFI